MTWVRCSYGKIPVVIPFEPMPRQARSQSPGELDSVRSDLCSLCDLLLVGKAEMGKLKWELLEVRS